MEDEPKLSLLELIWWPIFGSVVYILIAPGMFFSWVTDPSASGRESGELGLVITVSIIFWAIALAVGVGFLLPW